MYLSLSAVNRDSLTAFLKTAAILFQSYEVKLDAGARRYLSAQNAQAADFAKQFKLTKLIDAAVKEIVAGKNPAKDDRADELITTFAEALGPLRQKFTAETDIERQELGMLNDFRLAQNGSDAAVSRIHKNVSMLKDSRVNAMFVTESAGSDAKAIYKKMEALVKRHGNTAGIVMPIEVLTKWQASHKASGARTKAHTDYLALRKEAAAIQKAAVQTFIRQSGDTLAPVRDVIQHLKSRNIQHTIPTGFVGSMDDSGNFYTTRGLMLGQKLSGEVRMNPQYNPDEDNAYVCTFHAPFAAAPARAYTSEYRSGSSKGKYDTVNAVLPKLDSLTKKWLPGLAKVGKSREGVLATLCEFIYVTSARVGNKAAETAGKRTFGATQLQARHFTEKGSKIIVTYVGKSAGRQKHNISTSSTRGRRLGDALNKLLEGKTGTDPVFEFEGLVVSGAMINKYLVRIGFPKGFTIHKLRTAHGTQMATALLKESPFKKGTATEKEVNKWIETEMIKIGAALGHASGEKVTANTAIANYIAPGLLEDFYSKLGLRPSAKIQKAIDSVK